MTPKWCTLDLRIYIHKKESKGSLDTLPVEERFQRLLSENAALRDKDVIAQNKNDVLEKVLNEMSRNEAEQCHFIFNALNNLDPLKGLAGLQKEQSVHLQKELSTLQQLQKSQYVA